MGYTQTFTTPTLMSSPGRQHEGDKSLSTRVSCQRWPIETVRDAQAALGTIGDARAACRAHVRPSLRMRARGRRSFLNHTCMFDMNVPMVHTTSRRPTAVRECAVCCPYVAPLFHVNEQSIYLFNSFRFTHRIALVNSLVKNSVRPFLNCRVVTRRFTVWRSRCVQIYMYGKLCPSPFSKCRVATRRFVVDRGVYI